MQPTLKDITAKIMAFRDERDWVQFHNPKDLAAALAIEAAEIQELFLWQKHEEAGSVAQAKHERLSEEIADVAIYLCYLAEIVGIDLAEAIEQKLEKNSVKYPIMLARGSNKKHDEL